MFLWFVAADHKLPAAFRTAIQDPDHELFLSIASVWNAIIKNRIGKLPLPPPPAAGLFRQRDTHGISGPPVNDGAMPHLAGLHPIHRVPFYRTMVAPALQHVLTLVTVNPAVSAYPVNRLPVP